MGMLLSEFGFIGYEACVSPEDQDSLTCLSSHIHSCALCLSVFACCTVHATFSHIGKI